MKAPLSSANLRHVSGLDLAGGGQIVVDRNHAYIGHMKPPHGTSILDVSDPANPRMVAEIPVGSPWSHSHKVRVCGDRMITNVEQDRRHFFRKAADLPRVGEALGKTLGRPPGDRDLAEAMGVSVEDLTDLREAATRGYDEGGFRLWDIADPAAPRLLCTVRTHGVGVHRFDMDETHAYISTEMEGFLGNILVIYDISDHNNVHEISRWWMPGQHVAGGETPTWSGVKNRLHHALRVGDELWAAVWHAGFRVIDISDISAPKTVAAHDYHPPVVEPTHTVLPLKNRIGGRRIAVAADEEHEHRHGQPHAGLWVFDVTDLRKIVTLATFHVSEMDSPFARKPGRFGLHQFQEHIDGDQVFCAWFSGGLRMVDISDPWKPREEGFFIPRPRTGEPSPQSNDVDVDERGLVYLLDRNRGLDIIEVRK